MNKAAADGMSAERGSLDRRRLRRLPFMAEAARRSTAFWIGAAVIAMVLVFGLITPNNVFLRVETLLTVGLNASALMLLAVGMTFLLGAGQIDLSIGANVVLTSIVASKTITALGGSPAEVNAGVYPNLIPAVIAGVVVALVVGGALGAVNGLLISRLRINSFIVTLATTGLFYGMALVIGGGANVPHLPRELQYGFGINRVFDIVPLPLIVALAVSMVLWWTLRTTRFGLHTLAIGSSREAAIRAGINVDPHIVRLFALMGTLAGLAAMIDISRFATTNIIGHQTDNLQAIAAAVIGGTSLFGGVASSGGTLAAALIPTVLAMGLVIMRVPSFYQLIAVGVILLIAVWIDQARRRAQA